VEVIEENRLPMLIGEKASFWKKKVQFGNIKQNCVNAVKSIQETKRSHFCLGM